MKKLQKIQHNHAFKLLSGLGYEVEDIESEKTDRLLKRMGFKITSVRSNARTVSTFLGDEYRDVLQEEAAKNGISVAALVRDILIKHANKENKVL